MPKYRTKCLKVPLTDEERQHIENLARAARSKLAPFVRSTMLDLQPPRREAALRLAQINAELGALGREVAKSYPPIDALRLLLQLKEIDRVAKVAADSDDPPR